MQGLFFIKGLDFF